MIDQRKPPEKICEKCKKNPCQCKEFGPEDAEKRAEEWRKREQSNY